MAVCAAALTAFGCGGDESNPTARPHVVVLNWMESAGKPGERLILEVGSIAVGERTWKVKAAIRNDTAAPLFIGRPHTAEPATFGLVGAGSVRERGQVPTGLIATSFSPSLPRILDPGERWSGTFSGRGVIRRGTRVRVAVGTFWAYGGVRLAGRRRMLFRYFTERAVTL